ncbi:Morn repeat protein [Pandoravirus inopinatum]|uniref:Morn repeat protein n=1 Tax=Pandoravirus inopinatum TaxID=1605721 RepID=A0A0B5J4A7_9VIRU|nr:Morn repeat protein [Pandoravirus inopinatum]AJF98464.1 Morn repeat protein [Pandoravirus inopinatum]
MERTESSDGNRLADQDESDVATLAGVIGQEDADGNETDRDYDNKGEGGGDGVGGDDGGSDDDDDCLLFPETPEDELDEAHEAQCRRAYVAACGPGVPVFLAGARPRADKGWAWLLAAASGAPAQGRASVGRIDYGPHRFYVGDVNARGLPEGYGAVVHTRSDAFAPKKNVATTDANALGTPCRWPAPWALLKWHEGFWRAGQREGDGISVCLEYKVATEGRWRCDLLDGHGARTYGRGRWTLLPDGSGRGRWSGGDLWCHRGHWRDGERHGTGVLAVAGHAHPLSGVWVRGVLAGDVHEPVYCGPPPSRP